MGKKYVMPLEEQGLLSKSRLHVFESGAFILNKEGMDCAAVDDGGSLQAEKHCWFTEGCRKSFERILKSAKIP